ncbi:unnamed protein product [Camellia sinensis]
MHLSQRNPAILNKPGPSLLVLEILNYRLLSLYRHQGKSKNLMYDIMKIISTLKGKRGDHRIFRLAENLEDMLDQILSISQHTWSEKTLCYFPSILHDALNGRMDTRGLAIQKWQQEFHAFDDGRIDVLKSETTVIKQCTQLLSPSADPTYAMTYISHSFPMHRDYLCAGAWVLMHGHPENINSANLGCVLREFSPEEVTANIYKMVDVLLHHIHLELQHGHSLQELILKTSTNLAYFVWTNELLPLDILLLALIDRDDDLHALRIVGYPTFLDDITARLLPVIPLIIYRLIENDATDFADRVLQLFSTFLHYYPLNFTFVRDILAYFYGHLPGKLTECTGF